MKLKGCGNMGMGAKAAARFVRFLVVLSAGFLCSSPVLEKPASAGVVDGPQTAVAFYNRGVVYNGKRQYDKAIAD